MRRTKGIDRFIPGSIDRARTVSKALLIALIPLLFIPTALPAQDGEPRDEAESERAEAPQFFVVEEITFEITGWTRPDAVLAFLRFEKGAGFGSVEELAMTLERYERDLYNQRVFDEVEVRYELLPGEELPRRVRVHFYIDDGWTVLPVVFYRYNSNSGHNPFVVLYWDNFLGTLTNFGLSAGYYSKNWIDPYGWDIRVDFDNIRMLDRRWNFGFDQEFTTIEKSSPEGDLLLRYTYYSSDFRMSTGLRLNDRWRYSIAPGIGATYGYDTQKNVEEDRIPGDEVALTFSHGVGTGRQDWYRNFREGWNFGLSNSLAYSLNDPEVKASLSASTEFFEILGVFNPAVRFDATHHFDGDALSQGRDVRGVSDSRVYGHTLFKTNMNLAIRVLDIPRFSEFNLNPFLDTALAFQEDDTLGEDNFFVGAGVDLVLFPHFLRGFQGRISFGVDLRDLPSSISDFGSYELAITETLAF
ncbi:MAG: hypothetical protein ACLFPW_05460 [Spirochaetaceae bacterium]